MGIGVRLGAVLTAACAVLGPGAVDAAAAAPVGSVLAPGHTLAAGQQLRSPDGHYDLVVSSAGQLRLTTKYGRLVWATPAGGAGAVLSLNPDGDLMLLRRGHPGWQTNTAGAAGARLQVADRAILLSTAAGTAWSSVQGNGCGGVRASHQVIVRIVPQRAWLCAGREQVLVTPVTTGASSLGDGTPTGTWHVYAKVRDTTLYPSSGGAYPVHYWMPYHGAYGMHDSPWQRFAYGSSLYRTQGSHGCVHFPGPAMRELFGWAPVGTTVTILR